MKLPPAIFVTGTDTDVGKSVVSAVLCAGLSAHYWKPVQSGAQSPTDTQFVAACTMLPEHHFHRESYLLSQPLSPHAASRFDGVEIDLSQITPPKVVGHHLIIEGAGGLLVPLNQQQLVVDLIVQLQTPVILVARSGLGTINHTLLSICQLKERNIPLLGVVMNGARNTSNKEAIEHYGQTKVIAELPKLDNLHAQTIKRTFFTCFEVDHVSSPYLPHLASVHTDEDSAATAHSALGTRGDSRA